MPSGAAASAGYRWRDQPPDRAIRFRIGINIGDAIADGTDLHGDAVNVVSRLQAECPPGGICVSRSVRDHVHGRLDLTFEQLGTLNLKNISRPVEAFVVRLDPATAAPGLIETSGGNRDAPPINCVAAGRSPKRLLFLIRIMQFGSRHAGLFAAATILLLMGIGGVTWYLRHYGHRPSQQLSIVVLPFANLGSDPEQEYFADAITNDLTIDMSRIEDSVVIAANTARTYKGRNLDAKQIGRELNVRYILDGSLHRTENRVRVNAHLIDADSGTTIWSDRFDGDWTVSMQLEDEITGRLARRLDLAIIDEESRRAQSERPGNPNAVDLTMRAWAVLNQPYSPEQLIRSRELFEPALRSEPELPKALVGLALTLAIEVNYRWSAAPAEQLARADDAVNRVLRRFPNDAMAHFVKGEIWRARGTNFASAISEYEAAIVINPSLAPAYASLGNAKIRAGRAEEAFVPLLTAVRLSPRDPLLSNWYFNICHAYTHLAQDAAAIEWCLRSVALSPFWISYVDLASAYAWTRRNAEAWSAVIELRRLMPNYTIDRWVNAGFSDNKVFLAQYQRIIDGLRRAGLPEK